MKFQAPIIVLLVATVSARPLNMGQVNTVGEIYPRQDLAASATDIFGKIISLIGSFTNGQNGAGSKPIQDITTIIGALLPGGKPGNGANPTPTTPVNQIPGSSPVFPIQSNDPTNPGNPGTPNDGTLPDNGVPDNGFPGSNSTIPITNGTVPDVQPPQK
ncbi:hypothetical protein H072_2446 [Dactylellina haptotyla CBS 200.50]|uniref:Uncharacterized protein n=1 Tax=Dactylellina haptotyla (strain CBS 200.50) TaxID=1284197 RepID=S8AL44_DACHA|nr:hypothetical protein H072_2446 [Dactylellina haptotyla CBS 200.50]